MSASGPNTTFTRTAVARALSVSVAMVRKLEGKTLHPRVLPDGTHVFDPVEVKRVAFDRVQRVAPRESRGNVAARVFKRLDQGETLTSIVAAEQLEPSVVRELAEQWRDLKSEDLHTPSVPAELCELQRQLDEDRAWQEQTAAAFAQLNGMLNDLQDQLNELRPSQQRAGVVRRAAQAQARR